MTLRRHIATPVLAVVLGAALLAGCGIGDDLAVQKPSGAAGTVESPLIATTPGPGQDGAPGRPGEGAAGGAGGQGGSAGATADRPAYLKAGELDCPPNSLIAVHSNDHTLEASFDSRYASDDPEAVLAEDLRRTRKSTSAYIRYLADLRYEKLSQKNGWATFGGRREDGSVVRTVHAQRGGKSKSWLWGGAAFCSNVEARPNPRTDDDEDGDDPALGSAATAD